MGTDPMSTRILVGNCLEVLRAQPAESVHCCVTSPPYWGLRDYGIDPQIWGGDPACKHEWGVEQRTAWANSVRGPTNRGKNGTNWTIDTKITGPFCQHCEAWCGSFGLEPTPELYIKHLVMIFEEVRRVLRADGTLWLNLGDCYATGAGKVGEHPGGGDQGAQWAGRPGPGMTSAAGYRGKKIRADRDGSHAGKHTAMAAMGPMTQPNRMPQIGLKPKDLVGIPWMAAFALRAAGWWLRQDIIWSKPNPMPESVTDRCTKAHEYIFLMSKSQRYYFDTDAIKEGAVKAGVIPKSGVVSDRDNELRKTGYDGHRTRIGLQKAVPVADMRNKRSVWTVNPQPFSEAHFATFPPALIEPCIKAGCPEGGIVLDPFGGAGTTGLVADRLQRNALLIELNPDYAAMAERRITGDAPLFSATAAE